MDEPNLQPGDADADPPPAFSLAPDLPAAAPAPLAEAAGGSLEILREWADALLVAFVLAMFVRIFMLELFKIPSGSMTPTLIGGEIVDVDYNNDGRTDLVLLNPSGMPLLYLNDGQHLLPQGPVRLSAGELDRLKRAGRVHMQDDRILVNKFAYWFHPPSRGDVVVFKVPDAIWDPARPIYIKRCAGEPGETLSFDRFGRLEANGTAVESPPFFARQLYQSKIDPGSDQAPAGQIEYAPDWRGDRLVRQINVPQGQIVVFGDNTYSSLDSRYWGAVPLERVKGRAFFRYYPLSQMKFLNAQ